MRSGKRCGRPAGHVGTHRSEQSTQTQADRDKSEWQKRAELPPTSRIGKKTAKRKTAAAKAADHAWRVKTFYGITVEDYWAIYNFQGGRCAICVKATGRTKRLAVDHFHGCTAGHDPKKGCQLCVRGLLCSRCNRYLGLLMDDPAAFRRAARYLEEPPWPMVRDKAGSHLQVGA